MKTAIFCFLFFLSTACLAQQEKADSSVHSNYICNTLFKEYTCNWEQWWKSQKIKGHTPGNPVAKDFAHFTIQDSTLELLSRIGNGNPSDSLVVFFAFTSAADSMNNQISIVLPGDITPIRRWREWSQKNIINGTQPTGLKIRHADLDSIFVLMKDTNNPITSLKGYFIFHNSSDMANNRISVVFRPIFKNHQKKRPNALISCGASSSEIVQESFINIDFTNPCPPCDSSQ
jgi:hypothetical protein